MRITINIVAVIAFIAQLLPFAFNALNQEKTESTKEALYDNFMFLAYFCSWVSVVIFFILYNFNYKILKNKILNSVFLLIVLLGIYVHLSQIIVQSDFIIISSILLLFDCYVIRKVVGNLFFKSNKNS